MRTVKLTALLVPALLAALLAPAAQAANTFRSVVVTGVQRSFCAGGSLANKLSGRPLPPTPGPEVPIVGALMPGNS